MRKIKVLVTAFILAMMLVGTSYAMFTDSVGIHTSVSTGIMDVDIHENSSVIESKGVIAELQGKTIKMDNLVPGGYAIFNIVFENKGTIDIEFDNLTINIDRNSKIKKYIFSDYEYANNELRLIIELDKNTPNDLQDESTSFEIVTSFKQAI